MLDLTHPVLDVTATAASDTFLVTLDVARGVAATATESAIREVKLSAGKLTLSENEALAEWTEQARVDCKLDPFRSRMPLSR